MHTKDAKRLLRARYQFWAPTQMVLLGVARLRSLLGKVCVGLLGILSCLPGLCMAHTAVIPSLSGVEMTAGNHIHAYTATETLCVNVPLIQPQGLVPRKWFMTNSTPGLTKSTKTPILGRCKLPSDWLLASTTQETVFVVSTSSSRDIIPLNGLATTCAACRVFLKDGTSTGGLVFVETT